MVILENMVIVVIVDIIMMKVIVVIVVILFTVVIMASVVIVMIKSCSQGLNFPTIVHCFYRRADGRHVFYESLNDMYM